MLTRMNNEPKVVEWRDAAIQRMQKKTEQLHFTRLNHSQRIVCVQDLSQRPIRAINILSNKLTIPPGTYDGGKNLLYFYLARYLVERISWLCRDRGPQGYGGDGTVKIVFSRRGGMSYEAFQEYLRTLKRTTSSEINIHWPVIDIEAVEAKDHSLNAGLQLADVVASGFAASVEPNFYGNCEPRYAELLKPVTYERAGNYFSYGVKLVPSPAQMEADLSAEQKRLLSIFAKEEGQSPGP